MDLYSYRYLLDGILLALVLFKTYHFIKNKNANWKLYHWIYFGEFNIKGSTNGGRAKLKREQNLLSLIILVAFFVDMVIIILFKPF